MSIDNKTPKSFILTVVVRSSCEILDNPRFLSHLYSLSLAKQIWCPSGSVPWCKLYLILTYSMEVTIVKFRSLDLVNTFIKIMLCYGGEKLTLVSQQQARYCKVLSTIQILLIVYKGKNKCLFTVIFSVKLIDNYKHLLILANL